MKRIDIFLTAVLLLIFSLFNSVKTGEIQIVERDVKDFTQLRFNYW